MTGLWQQIRLLSPGWGDLFEILIVGYLIYRVLLLIRQTRAMQMLLGLLSLGAVYFVAVVFDLVLIRSILENLFQYGAIAALVVFQPELRAALSRLGQNRMVRMFSSLANTEVVDELVSAAERLARARIGAIIAIQREVGLNEYVQTGSALQARVLADLLVTIFSPSSPLHDGAVIVAGDTITAAGAILPLTQSHLTDRSLGTRHRAAIGLSEETDALVIVVSEELGRISLAYRGRIELGVDATQLRTILTGSVPPPGSSPGSPGRIPATAS